MKNIWIVPAVLACSLLAAPTAYGQEPTAQPVTLSIDSKISPVVSGTGSTVSINGSASAGAGVTRLTWQTSDGTSGTASGTSVWEAKDIPVGVGNTTIVLRAYDSTGSSAWVALVAVRHAALPSSNTTVISSAAKPQQPPAL